MRHARWPWPSQWVWTQSSPAALSKCELVAGSGKRVRAAFMARLVERYSLPAPGRALVSTTRYPRLEALTMRRTASSASIFIW